MLEIFSKNHNQTDSEQQTQSLPVNIATFYQIYQNLYLKEFQIVKKLTLQCHCKHFICKISRLSPFSLHDLVTGRNPL